MNKDLILQKKGINEDDFLSQDLSNSERINSQNFEYLEKIYYYEKKIKILLQKNKDLSLEVLKNRKIIIDLNNKNNYLLQANENLQKKYQLIEANNLISLSPFQNNNNININNFKIKNNSKNKLNLKIDQRKFNTGNNFYNPNQKNANIDTLSDFTTTNNKHKSSSINKNNNNKNIKINDYEILKENYSKKVSDIIYYLIILLI
jgi:hypothetical protein